ncbi:MAG TPA: O-antigen ligase family protein [Candidatus Limnocylindria bacterium]
MKGLTARHIVAAVMAGLAATVILIGYYRPAEQSPALGLAVAIVASAVVAAVSYLAVMRPWWGLVAFLAATPAINIARAQVWIGPVQLISATAVVLALIIGVGWELRRPRDPAGAMGGVSGITWGLLGGAAVLAIASTVVAPLTPESLNVTLHGALAPLAVLGCVLVLRPNAVRALHAMLALAGGVALAGLINLGWMTYALSDLYFYERRIFFARLTYFNVGTFGEMLVIALPLLAIPLLVRRQFGWPKWVPWATWGAIGVMILALFYTYTKSAWITATLGSTLVIILLVEGWGRKALLLVGTYLLLAVVVPYPYPVLQRVSPDLAEDYRSLVVAMQSERRVESWDPESEEGAGSVGIRWIAIWASVELVSEHPVLGVGPTRYGPEFARIRPDASVPNLSSAHNFLANLAAEYGLPLAVLVTFGLAVAMLPGLPALVDPDPLRRVAAVMVAIALTCFMLVATLFGIDLYRTFRTMNSDVIAVAVLVGLGVSLLTYPREIVIPPLRR